MSWSTGSASAAAAACPDAAATAAASAAHQRTPKLSAADDKKLRHARSLAAQARTRVGLGSYGQADAHFRQSAALLAAVLPAHHPETLAVALDAGGMWMSQHQFAKAEPYLASAQQAVQAGLRASPDDLLLQQQERRVLRDLAFLYYLQGSLLRQPAQQKEKWKKAEEALKRVIAITESALGKRSEELVEPLRNLASLYVKMGALHRSEISFKRCIGIQLVNHGISHPGLLVTRQQLAIVYERKNHQRCNTAATTIQGGWRMYKARKEASARRAALTQQQHLLLQQAGKPATAVAAAAAPAAGETAAAAAAAAATPSLEGNGAPSLGAAHVRVSMNGYYTPGTEGFGTYPVGDEDEGAGAEAASAEAAPPSGEAGGGGGGAAAERDKASGAEATSALAAAAAASSRSPLLPETLSQATTLVGSAGGAGTSGDGGGGTAAAATALLQAETEAGRVPLTPEEMELLACFPEVKPQW